MLKTIRKLLKTKAQREEAVADFLSTLGATAYLGTIGVLVLEEALIGAGILTREEVETHGILAALRKALDEKPAPAE